MSPNEVSENFTKSTVFCDMTIKTLQDSQKLTDKDSRITFFRKISQINDMTQISYDFYKRYLLTHQWWRDRFPNHIMSHRNKQNLCNSYDMFLRTNYMIENYSALESSIRIIAKAFDTVEYEKRERSFDWLGNWFLEKIGLKEECELLHIFSNIRNSMHSNGIFAPLNNKDEELEYRGKKFTFKVGEFIQYGDWQNLFSINKILCISFKSITQNHDIIKLTFIKEPASDFW